MRFVRQLTEPVTLWPTITGTLWIVGWNFQYGQRRQDFPCPLTVPFPRVIADLLDGLPTILNVLSRSLYKIAKAVAKVFIQ